MFQQKFSIASLALKHFNIFGSILERKWQCFTKTCLCLSFWQMACLLDQYSYFIAKMIKKKNGGKKIRESNKWKMSQKETHTQTHTCKHVHTHKYKHVVFLENYETIAFVIFCFTLLTLLPYTQTHNIQVSSLS